MSKFPRFSELPHEYPPVEVGQVRITNMNIPLKVLRIEDGRVYCQYADVEYESVCDMPVDKLETKSKVFSYQ